MKISILIVNFKSQQNVIDSIASVYSFKTKMSTEIVVVDNDNDKFFQKRLKKIFPKVICLSPGINLGFGAGNNLGVSRATGDYLLFLNPDTLFKSNVIDLLITRFTSPAVGAVSPVFLKTNGEYYEPQASNTLTLSSAIFSQSIISRFWPNNYFAKKHWISMEKIKKMQEIEVLNGACFMIRRDVFEKIGGFDENIFLFFEDNELSKRMIDQGYKIIVEPKAKVIHELGVSTRASQAPSKYFVQSRYYYFRKHFGLIKALIGESILRFGKIESLITLIFTIGIFLRFYDLPRRMLFYGDVGWFYWSAKQMIVNHAIPLVGITSSHTWLHQGPLWTYILGLLFTLFNFNPFVPAYFAALFGVFTILLVYFVTKEMFSEKSALISAFLYATSPLVIQNSRLAYHTTLIPTFVIIFIFSVYKFVKGDKKFFPVSIFLAAILYNFEISTASLISVFGLVVLFGFVKSKDWINKIKNRKVIFYSFLAFLIPMMPMIIYDFGHGFPQTIKFVVWTLYRAAQALHIPGIPRAYESQSWSEFFKYCLEALRNTFFINSSIVALVIFIFIIMFFSVMFYGKFKSKKLDSSEVILFLFVIIPTISFVFQKTSSDAYLPMLYPQWIILFGIVFSYLIKNKKLLITLGALVFLIGINNSYTLVVNNYYVKNNINTYIEAVNEIIKQSNGVDYNILGKGPGSQYESFVTPYKYIAWYLGKPVSEKNEKLKFYVSEYPDKIVVEKKK